jgi:cytochrome c oxidase assembly protein subunit 15
MPRSRVDRALSPVLGLLLFFQAGLVVTGGAVRLTGSGLGCPTWPRCTSGSFIPVPHQAQGELHSWIEFGNRLLTIALFLTSISALICVLVLRRRDIRNLARWQVLGILAQIPLGGITVLTHLNPIAVATHFILSMLLIAAGTVLYERRQPDQVAHPVQERTNRFLVHTHLLLTSLVIVVGTIVTGSGPNAGDASAPRFHFHFKEITWIHADLVIALILLTIYLYAKSAPTTLLRRRIAIFFAVVLAQGSIGFLQFYRGLPELLVGAHLLGVTLVWITAWRIYLAAK